MQFLPTFPIFLATYKETDVGLRLLHSMLDCASIFSSFMFLASTQGSQSAIRAPHTKRVARVNIKHSYTIVS